MTRRELIFAVALDFKIDRCKTLKTGGLNKL